MGIKDRIDAAKFAARQGMHLSKEQADAASEAIAKVRSIIDLSVKANSFVYEDSGDLKPYAADNFQYALNTLNTAFEELRALKPAGELSPTLNKELFKAYKRLMVQKVILEIYARHEDEPDDAHVQAEAARRAVEEW